MPYVCHACMHAMHAVVSMYAWIMTVCCDGIVLWLCCEQLLHHAAVHAMHAGDWVPVVACTASMHARACKARRLMLYPVHAIQCNTCNTVQYSITAAQHVHSTSISHSTQVAYAQMNRWPTSRARR